MRERERQGMMAQWQKYVCENAGMEQIIRTKNAQLSVIVYILTSENTHV